MVGSDADIQKLLASTNKVISEQGGILIREIPEPSRVVVRLEMFESSYDMFAIFNSYKGEVALKSVGHLPAEFGIIKGCDAVGVKYTAAGWLGANMHYQFSNDSGHLSSARIENITLVDDLELAGKLRYEAISSEVDLQKRLKTDFLRMALEDYLPEEEWESISFLLQLLPEYYRNAALTYLAVAHYADRFDKAIVYLTGLLADLRSNYTCYHPSYQREVMENLYCHLEMSPSLAEFSALGGRGYPLSRGDKVGKGNKPLLRKRLDDWLFYTVRGKPISVEDVLRAKKAQ